MDRIIAPGSVNLANADTAPITGTPQYATSGTPGVTPATVLPAYQYNAIQEELISIILAGGLTRDRTNNGQALQAIRNLITLAQGNLVNFKSITDANYEIVAADMGGYVVLSGATANRTFNLDNGAGAGDSIFVSNISTGHTLTLQIQTPSAALFFGQPTSILGGVTSMTLNGGDEVMCVWTGFNWHVQYYSADFMHKSANFSDVGNLGTALGNLTFGSANGVLKLPNFQNLAAPIIIQWNTGTLPNSGAGQSTQAITFNQAFPNQATHASGNARSTTGTGNWIPSIGKTAAPTLTGVTFKGDLLGAGNFNSTVAYDWFAIGN